MGKILKLKLNLVKEARPLTPLERRKFEKSLFIWDDMIVRYELDEAEAFIPQHDRYVNNFAEAHMHFLYNLILARFYAAKGDIESFNNKMAYLEARQPEFCNIHNHYYYRLVSYRERMNFQYRKALIALQKAEEVGQPEWADVAYYYGFAYCLSDMGYSRKAIEYFKKAQELADSTDNHRYDMYIQSYIARDCCKIGQSDEALTTINNCLRFARATGVTDSSTGFAYIYAGEIYYHLGRYGEALEYFDTAFPYIEDKSTGLYVRGMYYKAQTLRASNKAEECMVCIKDGMDMITSDMYLADYWMLVFDTLKHLMLISIPGSLEYIETVTLPKLIDFGFCDLLVEYYQVVINFCLKNNDTDKVVAYNNAILRQLACIM